MTPTLGRLLCWLGIHAWYEVAFRGLLEWSIYDCRKCGKRGYRP